MTVAVVVPCYNERDSLPSLLVRLDSMMPGLPAWHVVFVDDGSSDGTGRMLDEAVARRPWARVVHHERNGGLGAALATGFRASTSDVVCTLDCDCTYPPERMPELVALLDDADVATASPWHPSVQTDVSFLRRVLSRGVSVLYRIVLGKRIYTFSSIFRAYRRKALDRVRFQSTGFPAVTEILVKALLDGLRVVELPMPLGNRAHGQSKMSVPAAVRGHLDLLGKTLWWKWVAVALLACRLDAAEPLFRVLDLDVGEQQSVEFAGGQRRLVKLLSAEERRDPVQGAVREATVEVSVDGRRIKLVCGNYELPRKVGRSQVDCPVTSGYKANSTIDHWGLDKRARVRVWQGGSPWMQDGEFGFPLRQRWLATHTQMSNEPTYVDHGEQGSRRRIYYHAGLDQGGAEGMAQVVAATAGQVVSLGNDVLPAYAKDTPVAKRYDVIYLLDSRGWFYRYSHLASFEPGLRLGQSVGRGDRLGLLGKEGGSGGWSHLHFEAVSRQPSGKWGTQEGYAFLWEAAIREQKPEVVAVARPHRVASPGESVLLDGSRSWAASGKMARHEWRFTDGTTASGARVRRTYPKAGTYSEVLKVTDSRGRVAYDFATVNVLESPTIHAAFHPTLGIRAGQEVTFKVRTFGTTEGEERWDFGDGTPAVAVRSDGNVKQLAKDGYAITTHSFARPGDYVVRVDRTTAVAHLWVHVD